MCPWTSPPISMAVIFAIFKNRTSPIDPSTDHRLRPTGSLSEDTLESGRQTIADRIGLLVGRFRSATEAQPPISSDHDVDVALIRAAFAQLPADYQAVLTLQVRLKRSTTEIASELHLTLAQVLSRLHRARRELRLLCGEDTQLDPEA
jgi:hypothetical protein